MLEIRWNPKKGIWAEQEETFQKLRNNFFGEWSKKEKKLFLEVEEALFLINFQNAECRDDKGKRVGFNELAAQFSAKEPRFFINYNTFRDWRDRGLIARRLDKSDTGGKKEKSKKNYPSRPVKPNKIKAQAYWYPKSMFSVIDDEKAGQKLFNEHWFGQLGIYKQDRGSLLKLNFLESVFLAKHYGLKIIDSETGKRLKDSQILKQVIKEREYTKHLYDVYEEWRLNGYIVKTGFKFGSHFRIYFPGASPLKSDKWIHSRHVLHVFPKQQKLLISEWARVVRVAHSVKKTFLLSIPKLKKSEYVDYPADFVAYRRKKEKNGWVRETPKDSPRYLLVAVAEDEHIGGVELASLLKKAESMGLELLLSISDRETSITYYVLKSIVLKNAGNSDNEYYEIEWMKP
jgi:tRNA-intron endonuclease